ncbi:MAG: metallophosphoesterase [Deltaproteobacteria bacterium]|nr:metallophosphoesterase [Deltaproteobacteria bacterium]
MFGIILSSAFTMVHAYVFWRSASVPYIKRRVPRKIFIGAGVSLWVIFILGRIIGPGSSGFPGTLLELIGMNWLGVVFLMFVFLGSMDIITLFGLLATRRAPSLRGWALAVAGTLSVISLVQGYLAPVIQRYDVTLPGLPLEMDGTVIVGLSDMHLGTLLGESWLAARVEQVQAQKPDLVFLIGDIFEGYGQFDDALLGAMRRLTAPLGVWAVQGNHEFYWGGAGMKRLERTGFPLLRNRWVEVGPGCLLAGVDDLTAARRSGRRGDYLSKALAARPPGVTILLSHTPWEAQEAANAGVGLMLSGHTHGGQIWPFGYLVQLAYPLLEGRYEVSGMTVIVCRGTGTWGPHMRLWRPAEILRITLHAQ